jgi:hypothetical protein
MSNATQKVLSSVSLYNDDRLKWFFVGGATNSKQYVNGQMVGVPKTGAKAGLVTDFDDTQALYFTGLLDMPSLFTDISSTTADSAVEAFMKLPYLINMPLNSGTASRATDLGKPVYAVDNQSVTIVPTVTTYKNLVGWLWDIDSNTTPGAMPAALTGPNVWIIPVQHAQGKMGATWKQVAIPFESLRKPADFGTTLPNAGTSGILGVVENTYLTTEPQVKSFNAMGATTSNGARFMFQVPSTYPAASPIAVAVTAGMSVVASVTAKAQVDCVRYAAPTVNIGPGSGAGEQSINSTTLATKLFALTATNVVAGDILDVLVQLNIDDGGSTPMNGLISAITMNLIF